MDVADGGEIDEWFAGYVRARQEHALRVAVLPHGGTVGSGFRLALSLRLAG